MAVNVAFWPQANGNFTDSPKGLTEDQVKLFSSLKVGDRLIIFKNNPVTERHPTLSLTLSTKKST